MVGGSGNWAYRKPSIKIICPEIIQLSLISEDK